MKYHAQYAPFVCGLGLFTPLLLVILLCKACEPQYGSTLVTHLTCWALVLYTITNCIHLLTSGCPDHHGCVVYVDVTRTWDQLGLPGKSTHELVKESGRQRKSFSIHRFFCKMPRSHWSVYMLHNVSIQDTEMWPVTHEGSETQEKNRRKAVWLWLQAGTQALENRQPFTLHNWAKTNGFSEQTRSH